MKRLAAALVLAQVCASAHAGDLWGTATLRSYHFDRSAGYNEQNFGLGLEYRATDRLRLIGGEYRNSFSNRSWYAALAGMTNAVHVLGVDVRAGVALGVVTGYNHESKPGPAAPTTSSASGAPAGPQQQTAQESADNCRRVRGCAPLFMPMLAFEASGVEVKLGYLPKIDHKTSGVIALQVGVQF